MPSFKKIRERAAKRKGGDAALNKLLGAKPDNAALAKVPDDRILSTLAERISKEHASFGKFLAAWPADDQIGLTTFLGKNGSRLGGATGRYLLRWLGWDTYIVSRDMVAALRDAGLDIAEEPTSKKDLQKVQDQINAWVKETGLPRMHISRILSMSIGENNPPEKLQAYMGE